MRALVSLCMYGENVSGTMWDTHTNILEKGGRRSLSLSFVSLSLFLYWAHKSCFKALPPSSLAPLISFFARSFAQLLLAAYGNRREYISPPLRALLVTYIKLVKLSTYVDGCT